MGEGARTPSSTALLMEEGARLSGCEMRTCHTTHLYYPQRIRCGTCKAACTHRGEGVMKRRWLHNNVRQAHGFMPMRATEEEKGNGEYVLRQEI